MVRTPVAKPTRPPPGLPLVRPGLLDSAIVRVVSVNAIVAVILAAVFALLVFENQTDLIAENALLRSIRVGMQLRERIERLAAGVPDWRAVSDVVGQEAEDLDLARLGVFSDAGELLFALNRDAEADPDVATLSELRMIHRAVTSRDFESRLFTHMIDERGKLVELYVPFEFGLARTGVIKAEVSLDSVDRRMLFLRRQATFLTILVVVLHAGLIGWSYSLFVRPLRRLVQATDAIAAGQQDVQIASGGTYEIATLSESFRHMSDAISRMREEARAANPLSGLPGNVEIERHIRTRMESGEIFAILYCDLDNFKAYNDTYGFSKGDEVILYTRDCLLTARRMAHVENFFIGHQGGDDFVVACAFDSWERFAEAFVTLFDEGAGGFYTEKDRERGYIESTDRGGSGRTFPLITVSVAVVTNQHRGFESYGQLVSVVAEMKGVAKRMPGSGFAIDRRSE
jgi:GGDEF domain-containing protein